MDSSGLGGGGVTSICSDTGVCHYFGYFFGGALGFLGIFLGVIFFVKFDLFWNDPYSHREGRSERRSDDCTRGNFYCL